MSTTEPIEPDEFPEPEPDEPEHPSATGRLSATGRRGDDEPDEEE